jgi:hypothetical protein
MVVSLPVEGITENDGLAEKGVLQEGVYLAGAITKLRAGFAITSIVNTNEKMVEIDAPVLRVTSNLGPQQSHQEMLGKRVI